MLKNVKLVPLAASLNPSIITKSLSFLGFFFSFNRTDTISLSYISINSDPKCLGYRFWVIARLGYNAFLRTLDNTWFFLPSRV